MENIMMLVIGLFIAVIGIVNICGNISTVHSYNRRNVTESDAPKYGKAVGTGTLIIGAALVLAFVLKLFSIEAVEFAAIPAMAVGLGFIIYGQIKYNKSIF